MQRNCTCEKEAWQKPAIYLPSDSWYELGEMDIAVWEELADCVQLPLAVHSW